MLNIPQSLARTAFAGTSFDPEGRGKRAVEGYQSDLAQCLETLRQHAEKAGTLNLLDTESARFTAGFQRRVIAYLASSSRCVSSFIAGPSNFPVRRMQKRSDIAHKRMGELYEYKARAMKAAIRNLRPDLRPIMAGDSDAIERLEAEIARAEVLAARMKAVNAAHRAFLKDPASLDAAQISEQDKEKVRRYKPEYSWEPHPFAPYQLSNHNANLRRMEKRLEQLTATKAAPVELVESASGIRLEDDPPANRVRLFFPGKPDEDTRSKLKKNGFRWSPTVGAWQAYRNTWSMNLAASFVRE